MKLKNLNVNVRGLHQVFWPKLFILDQYWREVLGYELVITSAVDGEHMPYSLHFIGCAIDIRTWKGAYNGEQLEGGDRDNIFIAVIEIMSDDFQIIDEGDHFHIEYNIRDLS